jgi:hypothetical protein
LTFHPVPPPVVVESSTPAEALAPGAKQVVAAGHEMPTRPATSLGTFLNIQLVAPSVVAMTMGSVRSSPDM